MRRAAIFALLLIAVCTGGLWLSRGAGDAAPPIGDSQQPPVRHVVVDPTPISPPPGARVDEVVDGGHRAAAAAVDPPIHYGPIEVAASPFADPSSPELRYAITLLFGPDAGTESFTAAGEAFERCLQQLPSNPRCAAGLIAAQKALKTGSAGALPPELSVEAIELKTGPFPNSGKMHKAPGIPADPP